MILSPVILNQYYNYLLEPVSKQQSTQTFRINPGQPVSQIAKNLKKAGLVKNAFAFRLAVAQMGIEKNIQAGEFRLSPNLSSRAIATELTHGAVDVWVTLPEGLRVEEIAKRLESQLKFGGNDQSQFNREEFINLAQEGYMFPDTFLIPRDATTIDIVQKLKNTFETKVGKKILASGANNNLTENEVVILASLIEREAKTSKERPIISGILLKRLRAGMALQVDASVQYAKGYDPANNSWWSAPTQEDYQKVKSPYNTYLFPGLPSGPICNPGLESIKAAVAPVETEYWYYLHDREGKIHYAETIEEHNKNIQEFL